MRFNKCKKLLACGLVICMMTAFAGCGSGSGDGTVAEAANVKGKALSTDYYTNAKEIDTSDMFTDRDLEGTYDESEAQTITLSDEGCESSAKTVEIDGQTVTITEEGVYLVSGSLSDGQIVVDAADDAKVQIVLNGAEIANDDSAAIYVKAANKVFVTAAEGSENSLTVTGDDSSDKIDGVIFAKTDLTVNGTGALTVSAKSGHGIVSKDDLVLAGLTLTVSAKKKALSGNNSVRIASGTYELTAGTDGIHAEDEDKSVGFIYIADGSVTINAEDDGIHAYTDLIVDGGTVNVAKSKEGLEGNTVTLNGGDVDIASTDDGINAVSQSTKTSAAGDGSDTVSGATKGRPDADRTSGPDQSGESTDQDAGNSDQNAGDSDQTANNSDQTANDSDQTENSDSNQMERGQKGPGGPGGERPSGKPDGERPSGSDDQAASGNRESKGGFGARMGGGMGGMDVYDESCLIVITGGDVHVNADGDGIDSNGSIEITGGTTYVEGPTNSGNGIIDVGGQGTATIAGGYFIATGSSGMAVQFSDQSTQGCILQTVDQTTGTASLKDSSGKTLISLDTDKEYSCVQVSAPEIQKGSEYTLTTGSSEQTITMDSLIYGQAAGGDFQKGDLPNLKNEQDGSDVNGTDQNGTEQNAADSGVQEL